MTSSRTIRRLLRTHPDGLTHREIAEAAGLKYHSIQYALGSMQDVYIDRWVPRPPGVAGPLWLPVYCAVVAPPNCPHPIKESETQCE